MSISKSFILMFEADEHYVLKVEAPLEAVRKAVLNASDSNNAWIEYDIPNMGKVYVLSGLDLYNQADDIFEALKAFKTTCIESTSMIQGHEID